MGLPPIACWVLLLSPLLHGGLADLHRFGVYDHGSQLELSKQLVSIGDDDSTAAATEPRNYTVIFKLFDQQPYARVSCVELNVEGNVSSNTHTKKIHER